MSHLRRLNGPRPGTAGSIYRLVRASLIVATASFASLAAAPAVQAGPLMGTGSFGWSPEIGTQVRAGVVGDLNGDGRDDVAVGQGMGLRIVFGTRNGVNRDNVAAGSTTGLYELQLPGVLTNVEAAGDFDGDGIDDMIVSTGAKAYVFYGGSTTPEGVAALVGSGRVTTINGAAPTGASDPPLQGLGIGDFDGNGRDDVAMTRKGGAVSIVYGGSRTGSIDANGKNARTSVINGPVECGTQFYVIPVCGQRTPMTSAVGDFNGDGRDDLAIDTLVGAGDVVAKRFVLFGRTGTFTTSAGSPSNAMEIPRPVGNGTAFYSSMPTRVGDLSGDGRDELHLLEWAPPSGPGTRYFLGTATPPASLNPLTAPSIDVLGAFGGKAVGDQNGDGRRDIAVLKPRGTLSAPAYRSRGELAFVTAPSGAGMVDAAASTVVKGLPTGEYLGSGLLDFDGDGQLDLALKTDEGGRNPYASPSRQLFFLATHGVDVIPPYLFDASISPIRFVGTDGGTLSITAEEPDTTVELAYTQYVGNDPVARATERRTVQRGSNTVPVSGVVNGEALPAGQYDIWITPIDAAGNRGPEKVVSFTLVSEDEETADLPWSVGGLGRSGDAVLTNDGSVMLTNGNAGSKGTAVFPLKRDYNGFTVEFDASFYGDGVEGMTLAFITAEPDGNGSWMGAGGPQLAYRGLDGYALAFDLRKGPNDPSGNFIGWTVGGPVGGGLKWLQTADPGAPLQAFSRSTGPSVKVKLVLRDARAKVYIDGSLRMERYMLLPEETRLAFTAASEANTGALVEVANLKVTPS